jgi:hypothetical protein
MELHVNILNVVFYLNYQNEKNILVCFGKRNNGNDK